MNKWEAAQYNYSLNSDVWAVALEQMGFKVLLKSTTVVLARGGTCWFFTDPI